MTYRDAFELSLALPTRTPKCAHGPQDKCITAQAHTKMLCSLAYPEDNRARLPEYRAMFSKVWRAVSCGIRLQKIRERIPSLQTVAEPEPHWGRRLGFGCIAFRGENVGSSEVPNVERHASDTTEISVNCQYLAKPYV